MRKIILIVDDDPMNLKLVERVLEKENFQIFTATNGFDAITVASQIKPDLILMDVMMPQLDGFAATEQIRLDPEIAHTPILMLTALHTLDEKLKGFNAGADEFLEKPFKPQELIMQVRNLMRKNNKTENPSQNLNGKIISTFSLRGGTGTSTLAANIAAGLSQLWEQEVILADLNFDAGQVDLMFNLPTHTSWADIASQSPQDIDIHLLKNIKKDHESGVSIIASPNNYEKIKHITPEHIQKTLTVLKEEYNYIVLDLNHNFDHLTLEALKMSDEIMVIVTPDFAAIRSTTQIFKKINTLFDLEERTRLVLNWTQKQGLSQEEMEKSLDRKFDLIIPHAPVPINHGLNTGKPPVYYHPEHPIGALFEDLSLILSKPEHKSKRPQAPSESWKRTFERMRKRYNEKLNKKSDQ